MYRQVAGEGIGLALIDPSSFITRSAYTPRYMHMISVVYNISSPTHDFGYAVIQSVLLYIYIRVYIYIIFFFRVVNRNENRAADNRPLSPHRKTEAALLLLLLFFPFIVKRATATFKYAFLLFAEKRQKSGFPRTAEIKADI